MRTIVWGTMMGSACAVAVGVGACVGDDPGTTSTASPDAATSASDSSSEAPPDADPAGDGGMPRDAGADVFCSPGDPQTFAPLLGMGPFCGPGVHCQFGEHCCRDLELNSQTCASSCPPSTVDIACLNGAECNVGGDLDGGMICCATGTVELGVCSYAVSKDVTSTRCTTSCTDQEFEVCASSGECNGTTCTPTRALKADGQSTSAMQIAACR